MLALVAMNASGGIADILNRYKHESYFILSGLSNDYSVKDQTRFQMRDRSGNIERHMQGFFRSSW